MKINFIEEPELEFGSSNHIDVKFGIMNYGVLDFDSSSSPREIKLGIIGSSESIEKFLEWINIAESVITAKKSNKHNLFPKFPGFNSECAFYSQIFTNSTFHRTIDKSTLEELTKLDSKDKKIKEFVNLVIEEIEYLINKKVSVDVIVIAIPLSYLKNIEYRDLDDSEISDKPEPILQKSKDSNINLRQILKAKTLKYGKPIQIVLPTTYDDNIKRKLKINREYEATLQDKATRAWNFFTALYYKSGGVPWRLIRKSDDFQTCYIGVSFYESKDQQSYQTSVAQVFNERGEGIIIKGGQAYRDKVDRQVHLDSVNAKELLIKSLKQYTQEHRTKPARIVIHKSSEFNIAEIDGFVEAIKLLNIDLYDFISLKKSFTRLHRNGKYPPLRGVYWELDEQDSILYTRGSVDFFETYPGLYIPKSLKITVAYSDQTNKQLATEILALTKMNWNNTQLDNSIPITLKAARNVGDILKYVEDDYIASSYCFYM